MTAREAWQRLRGAFSRRSERDLHDELRFHREALEDRYRAGGLDAAEAARAARIAVGGSAQIVEVWRDQRGLPWLDALRQDLRYGVRTLRRTPGFTAAALLTLALGIGANTAIFTIVDAVLLRPLPYPSAARIVAVGDRNASGVPANVGFETVADWRARSRTFDGFAMLRGWTPTLVIDGEAERLPAARVSWNYFDVLGVRPALGRPFTEADDQPAHWRVLLLSDRLWRRRFSADPSIVGRTVTMNDQRYEIVGVMPASYEPLSESHYQGVDPDAWAPIGYAIGGSSACRSCQHLQGFGRLKAGVSLADAAAEMNAIRAAMRREHPSDYPAGTLAVVPLRDALTAQARSALLVLLGAVAFVLLIACANVANLLLARSTGRRRELTLRSVLGADRNRIVRQLLTESLMLSAGGAAIGIALAAVGVRSLAAFAPASLPRLADAAIDGRVLAFTAVIAMAAGVAFGLAPAWSAAVPGAQHALAVDSRSSIGGSSRLRGALVVLDLVMALVLLAGAGLMLRTVAAMMRVDPGFNPVRLLSMQMSLGGTAYSDNAAVLAFQQRALTKLRAIPGVEDAALADQIPFGGNYDCRGFHAKGRMKPNTADDPCIERYGVTPGYFRMLGIGLRAGRTFTDADRATSQPVVVVSESTARCVWGSESPLGSLVRVGSAADGDWLTVVGVVADGHHQDLTAAPTAAFYTPESQDPDSDFVAIVKASGEDVLALAAPSREVLRELDRSAPVYGVASVSSLIELSTAERLLVTRLLIGFAGVAVLLAAIGLYGVVSYGVAQRTREVGVRVALGASRRDVMRLVLFSGLSLVAGGVAGGLLAATLVTRFLGALIFGVSPIDPTTLAAAAIILVIVALLAHWIPTRRALGIDPAMALRGE